MLENTEGSITNRQSRETGNIGYTRSNANRGWTQVFRKGKQFLLHEIFLKVDAYQSTPNESSTRIHVLFVHDIAEILLKVISNIMKPGFRLTNR
jgi:hypothetical protein